MILQIYTNLNLNSQSSFVITTTNAYSQIVLSKNTKYCVHGLIVSRNWMMDFDRKYMYDKTRKSKQLCQGFR